MQRPDWLQRPRAPPTAAELAAATGMSVGAVLNARSAGLPPVSLDEPVLPDGSSLASVVADPSAADPELKALEHEQAELLEAALENLAETAALHRQPQVGIGGAPMSITDLAAELELSTRRTQTIGRDALYELRAALEPRKARLRRRLAQLGCSGAGSLWLLPAVGGRRPAGWVGVGHCGAGGSSSVTASPPRR